MKDRSPPRQHGATLTIAMIMLILLTLFVLAAINMSSINLRIMGNEQARNESIAATQQAVEQVMSTNFPLNPQAQAISVVSGDGNVTYSVAVDKPVCMNSVPIKSDDPSLNLAVPSDANCLMSSTMGTAGGTGNSLCANTQWDIRATVADTSGAKQSGTNVTVHQGTGVRALILSGC